MQGSKHVSPTGDFSCKSGPDKVTCGALLRGEITYGLVLVLFTSRTASRFAAMLTRHFESRNFRSYQDEVVFKFFSFALRCFFESMFQLVISWLISSTCKFWCTGARRFAWDISRSSPVRIHDASLNVSRAIRLFRISPRTIAGRGNEGSRPTPTDFLLTTCRGMDDRPDAAHLHSRLRLARGPVDGSQAAPAGMSLPRARCNRCGIGPCATRLFAALTPRALWHPSRVSHLSSASASSLRRRRPLQSTCRTQSSRCPSE